MMVFGGPLGILLVAAMVVAAFVVWLIRRPRHPGPRLVGDDGVDRDELEAAEREVRELEAGRRPEDGFEGDDWGPGAAKPRPPVRL
jgi:hypothetical protein